MSVKSSQVAQRKQLIDAATASPELIKVQQMSLNFWVLTSILTFLL